MRDGEIEVIEVDFALKSKFMISFEDVEGKSCSRAVEGSRVPAHSEQLPVMFVPCGVRIAGTEQNPNIVQAVNIENGEIAG